jgi:hypothetical protein
MDWRLRLSRVLLVAGLSLLVTAGWLAATEHRGPPLSLTVSPSELGQVKLGSSTPLVMTVTNAGSVEQVVIGFESFCGRAGCIRAEGLPLKVPPRGSAELKLFFDAKFAAPDTIPLYIYTTAAGQMRIGTDSPVVVEK